MDSFFRYLQRGCTQYFVSKESEKKIPNSRKSQDQLKLGSLKDPMQDDYKNYQNIDRNLKNIGMSDPDRQVIFCFYFHWGFVILFKKVAKMTVFEQIFDFRFAKVFDVKKFTKS